MGKRPLYMLRRCLSDSVIKKGQQQQQQRQQQQQQQQQQQKQQKTKSTVDCLFKLRSL